MLRALAGVEPIGLEMTEVTGHSIKKSKDRRQIDL